VGSQIGIANGSHPAYSRRAVGIFVFFKKPWSFPGGISGALILGLALSRLRHRGLAQPADRGRASLCLCRWLDAVGPISSGASARKRQLLTTGQQDEVSPISLR